MFKKILSILLYSLPIVFFIVCYFLIVTSGEDIFQGANSQPDIIGDSVAAFNHSARLADMYAWASINFFGYTFQFGPDFFLRLLDVALAFCTFYLATYLALGRRPKLVLKDASVFAGIFLAIFLTSYGTTLYGGFSKIHNYLIISLVSLGFCLIYAKDLLGKKPFCKTSSWQKIAVPIMLFFGFIFGLTSSVTAAAFLLCVVAYLIYLKASHQKFSIPSLVFSWRGASILGILIALFCIYVLGPGLADYDTNPVYQAVGDYLPLRDIFVNFGASVIKVIKHIGFNFGRFLAPFFVLSLPPGIYILILKSKQKLKMPHFSRVEKNFLVADILFIIIHLLALSQIYYFTRMVLPVYFVGLALYFYLLQKIFSSSQKRIPSVLNHIPLKPNFVPLALIEITLMLTIIIIRSTFAINYQKQVSPILERARTSEEKSFCITPEQVKSYNLPYIYLGQEDMLVDWAMPQTVYGKTITYCDQE